MIVYDRDGSRMDSSSEKACIQKRLLDFIKTDRAILAIFFPLQVVCSFCVSYLLVLQYPLIPVELSNRILSSTLDVSIALFGFAGLILVFTFRNLLTTKGDLQKERFEISLKMSQFDVLKISKLPGGSMGAYEMIFAGEAQKKCEVRTEEIDDELARNKMQIERASFLGFGSLGIAFVCILVNVGYFGLVRSEGMNFLNLTILLSLFFLWLDFILSLVRTVIRRFD